MARPDVIATAVPLVLADLGDPVAATDVTWAGDGELVLVTVRLPEGDTAAFGVDPEQPPARVLVDVADRLQDIALEATAARGDARPACPGHRHPARAEVVDGEASWVCPADGRVVARIGA